MNPTADLHGERLVRGPDLSGERDGVDRFGHGTFMAGLIAGDGTASSRGATRHVGAAPGATVVSVKVAGADGSTTLSRMIAGIGWVIMHEDDYDIGVLNLSFGADTNLPYIANPLSGAVEAAWASGLTVVTSAGNAGAGSVSSPGDDPWVITVGSSDSSGTNTTADDSLATFSGRKRFGGYSKPDVVAPGVSVVSLRAPGSAIDAANPSARLGDAYFKGSGTSMSTAIVSGAAAVLVEHHPNANPDDVKGALVDGGIAVKGSSAPGISVQPRRRIDAPERLVAALPDRVRRSRVAASARRCRGPRPVGPLLAGRQPAGPPHVGRQPAGPPRAGRQLAGRPHVGRRRAGPTAAGPTPTGPRAAGPRVAGRMLHGTLWAGARRDNR